MQMNDGEIYRISFDSGHGLHIQNADPQSSHANTQNYMDADDRDKFSVWIQNALRNNMYFFSVAFTWGSLMVILQIVSLLLLTFEPTIIFPGKVANVTAHTTVMYDINDMEFLRTGLRTPNNLIRFISDNIDTHRGYGALMLLSFGGSFFLVACVITTYYPLILFLISTAASGGLGVVMFHGGGYDTHHITCAGVFIGAGILVHASICFAGNFRGHILRDVIMLSIAAATGSVFLVCFLIANHEDGTRSAPTSRLRSLWLTAAVCEYLLFLSMVLLNLLIPTRLLEQVAHKITNDLPDIIMAHKRGKRVE